MINRNLVYISEHTLGFTLRGCLFQNNSSLDGLVFINLSPVYSKGVIFYSNEFYQNSGYRGTSVLNL